MCARYRFDVPLLEPRRPLAQYWCGGRTTSWIAIARDALIAAHRDGGWSYVQGQPPATEPTVLAGLALMSLEPRPAAVKGLVRAAATALARRQLTDGSVGVSAQLAQPGWPTPWALLLWRAMGAESTAQGRGLHWLLQRRGKTVAKEAAKGVLALDVTLVGWPWVAKTHSWVEPTALAVLAAHRCGRGDDARVAEGLRLLRDRAVPTGGWNWGNVAVFGTTLRPQPDATGLALLALATARRPGARPRKVELALSYLQRKLPQINATRSLCWGTLGLNAWGDDAAQAAHWLEQAFSAAGASRLPAPRLAELLLAANAPRTLALLGLEPTP